MSATGRLKSIAEELRSLGRMRTLFEPQPASLAMCTVRGAFPMAIGTGLILAAPQWFPGGGWKCNAIMVVAGLVFLNGLRVVVIAWMRSRQKVATFEHGFAVWRHASLQVFRWPQIEDIEVSAEFLGFAVSCRTEKGSARKLRFDSASDPTDRLRLLWRDLEEGCWRTRVPDLDAAIQSGGAAEFVKKTWGKATGTRLVVDRFGIAATPRYKPRKFMDWLEVDCLRIEKEELAISRKGEATPWLSESIMALAGSFAILETGERARHRFLEIARIANQERCPKILAKFRTGRDVDFGGITTNEGGIHDQDERVNWEEIEGLRLDSGSLEVFGRGGDVSFDVEMLPFEEQVALRALAEQMRETLSK